MNKIALLGYSGHAYVVAEAILKTGKGILGYFDIVEAKANPFNLKYLGDEKDDAALSIVKNKGASFFVGVGDNCIRRKLTGYLTDKELSNATIIHPSSIVSDFATLGEGTFVAAGSMVNTLAEVGKGAIINTGAIVEHECQVGDYAHIAPGAVLAGNVSVGEGSFIGANAVVKQGVKIGYNAIVGAGAVVLKNVPDNVIWVGNPAIGLKNE